MDVGNLIGVLAPIVGLLTLFLTERLRRAMRRGRARFVHEDLMRLQSTVARLYYQTVEGEPGERSWALEPLATRDDQQDVVGYLRTSWRFHACASALGWADYLRAEMRRRRRPSDDELRRLYVRFATGRRALSRLAGLRYTSHDVGRVISSDLLDARDEGLPKIDDREALKRAKARAPEPELVSWL